MGERIKLKPGQSQLDWLWLYRGPLAIPFEGDPEPIKYKIEPITEEQYRFLVLDGKVDPDIAYFVVDKGLIRFNDISYPSENIASIPHVESQIDLVKEWALERLEKEATKIKKASSDALNEAKLALGNAIDDRKQEIEDLTTKLVDLTKTVEDNKTATEEELQSLKDIMTNYSQALDKLREDVKREIDNFKQHITDSLAATDLGTF